jgi:hypothetical protein
MIAFLRHDGSIIWRNTIRTYSSDITKWKHIIPYIPRSNLLITQTGVFKVLTTCNISLSLYLSETNHFGSFLCICNSPNGGWKVEKSSTDSWRQTSKKLCIHFVKNLNVWLAVHWTFLKMPVIALCVSDTF